MDAVYGITNNNPCIGYKKIMQPRNFEKLFRVNWFREIDALPWW